MNELTLTQELILATWGDDYELLIKIISDKANKLYSDYYADNSLTLVQLNKIGEIRKVLKHFNKSNTNIINSYKLLFAIIATEKDLIDVFLDKNNNDNYFIKNSDKDEISTDKNVRLKIVELLLTKKETNENNNLTFFNVVNTNLNTALVYAIKTNNKDIIDLLLEHNNRKNCLSNFLMCSITQNNLEIVKWLLINMNINFVKNDETFLYTAIEKGYEDIVELLIKHGANVNVKINTLLINKIKNKWKQEKNKLLFISKNSEKLKKINEKITNEIKNIIDKYYNLECIPCSNIEKALIDFLDKYNKELEKQCIEKKLNSLSKSLFKYVINNILFQNNDSLLHKAVIYNMENLCKYLIDNGADGNFVDATNMTAWNHACMLVNAKMCFWIKKNNELNDNDIIFLNQYINLSTARESKYFMKENEKTERTEILEYYEPYIDIPNWLFLEEKNTLDNKKDLTPTKNKAILC